MLVAGTKSATYTNVNGIYNPAGSADGTDVNIGVNNFLDAATTISGPTGLIVELDNHVTLPTARSFRADGSAGIPAFSFVGDEDSGMYLNADGQIGWSVAGTRRARLTTSAFYLEDGINLSVGTTTGTKIGSGSTQKLGFFGTTPAARPTGVAVDAAGIHAALVTLGLITA